MRTVPLIAAALVSATVALGPAVAGELVTTENEATYLRYHVAIRAAERCNQMEFTQEQHSVLASYVSEQIGHDIGAKRLRLIGEAKRQAEKMTSGGCENDRAKETMALYDAELAPLVE